MDSISSNICDAIESLSLNPWKRAASVQNVHSNLLYRRGDCVQLLFSVEVSFVVTVIGGYNARLGSRFVVAWPIEKSIFLPKQIYTNGFLIENPVMNDCNENK